VPGRKFHEKLVICFLRSAVRYQVEENDECEKGTGVVELIFSFPLDIQRDRPVLSVV
jgi:hypothetical protein